MGEITLGMGSAGWTASNAFSCSVTGHMEEDVIELACCRAGAAAA
jgi:hypothetical protein